MRNIAVEFKSLNNLIMRDMEQRSRGHIAEAVTGTNALILSYILNNAERDVYQRELESEFGVTRSTASKVINLMEKKGFVERVTSETDARQRQLRLTDLARRVAEDMRRESDELSQSILKGFSPEEVGELFNYLDRMKENMHKEGD